MSKRSIFAFLPCLFALLAFASSASAETLEPWWHLTSGAQPTNLLPGGGENTIVVVANNVGDGTAEGSSSPIRITDQLPAGLTATAIAGWAGQAGFRGNMSCEALPALSCSYTGPVAPYEQLEVRITVNVEGASSGEQNTANVAGGSARARVGGPADRGRLPGPVWLRTV
jgi:hypothetical protein